MAPNAAPAVSGNLGFSTNVSGSAAGPMVILLILTAGLVLHYMWTRPAQGGRG